MKRIIMFILFSGSFCLYSVMGQTLTVTGTVSSAVAGEGTLPGVSVVARGTTTGTTTDANGKYSLNVPPQVTTLVFSYIGMKSQEIEIAGRTTINVILEPETMDLGEVVVTALGIKRSEKSIGYAASTVGNEEINAGRSSSLVAGLQGKVAGLTVSSSGGTGSSQKVYIRGVSSFTGTNQPLYVINGVPMSNNFAGQDIAGVNGAPNIFNNTVDFGNQANDVNPDDVESVTVLKGASATALYGSRAANGVIMITTRRGNAGEGLRIVYSGSFMGSDILRVPQTQHDFGQGWPSWDPAENGSWGPALDGRMHVWGAYSTTDYGPGYIPEMYSDYIVMQKPFSYVENNLRNFYETGLEFQNNISISGGNGRNSFSMSYGNTWSDGVLPTDADLFRRNILSFRGDYKGNRITASYDISYVRKDIDAVSAGQGNDGATLYQELMQMPVDINISGLKDYNSIYNNIDNFFTVYVENPYWIIDHNGNKYQDDRVYGKVEIGLELLKNTRLMGRVGGDFTNLRQKSYNSVAIPNPDTWNYIAKTEQPGSYSEFNKYIGQLDASGLITGDYKFLGSFRLNAIAGINYNWISTYNSNAYLYGLAVPGWFSLSNGSDQPVTVSSISEKILIGALGQFDLSYREWAFLTLSLRNDWSSTLPPEDNSYFYAGINGAVLLTEALAGLKNNRIINYAKLRLAWGQTGNDAPIYRTNTNYIPTKISLGFGNLDMPIGGVPGMTLSNINGNINLKPEITTDTEFGADIRLFQNRIGLDVAYYLKSTRDQIINSSTAPETQFTSFTRNVGQVDNKGFEARLALVPVSTNAFEWEIVTTYAQNRSKVVKLWDEVQEYKITSAYLCDFVAIVGQPMGVFKVPQPLYTADGKIIVNNSGWPMVDQVNKKIVGNREPDFVIGLTNRLTYKGFTLTGVLDYRKGGKFWSYNAHMLSFNGNSPITVYNNRQPFLVPNSVKIVGGNYVENDIPILGSAFYSYYNQQTNNTITDRFVLDKTFLKLREITLSYSIPGKVLGKSPFKGIELSLIGRNLLMWTPAENNLVDPEASNLGNDLISDLGEFGAGPTSRFFGGNIKLTF